MGSWTMSGESSSVNRRSVLKATGAALGGGLVATGTAAACNKVRVENDYYLLSGSDYLSECVDDATGHLVEKGTELYVYDTCDSDGDSVGGPIYYMVECGGDLWISDQHATCIDGASSPPPCLSG